jgi:hypothetical protein
VKPGILCLLLLSGCLPQEDPPRVFDYALTWTCRSPEGCERMEEVQRIDRLQTIIRDCQFTSTQDASFSADATLVISEFLQDRCYWLYFLTLFDHELPQSRFCFTVAGFEWEFAIPNEDPATSSMWLVEGRDVNLL